MTTTPVETPGGGSLETEGVPEGSLVHFRGDTVTFIPDTLLQVDVKLLAETPALEAFLGSAGNLEVKQSDLLKLAVGMLSATEMPRTGHKPYASTTLGIYGRIPGIAGPTAAMKRHFGDAEFRARAVSRLATDVAVGPFSNLSVESAANFLAAAFNVIADLCRDPVLAAMLIDRNVRHLETYYLARIMQAHEGAQGSGHELGERQAIAQKLHDVLVNLGLMAPDHVAELPANYFGMGKPEHVIKYESARTASASQQTSQ